MDWNVTEHDCSNWRAWILINWPVFRNQEISSRAWSTVRPMKPRGEKRVMTQWHHIHTKPTVHWGMCLYTSTAKVPSNNFMHFAWPGLTDHEITSQGTMLLFAGYETSTITLTFLAYSLARNPQVMKRLQEEIDSTFPEKVELRLLWDESFPWFCFIVVTCVVCVVT